MSPAAKVRSLQVQEMASPPPSSPPSPPCAPPASTCCPAQCRSRASRRAPGAAHQTARQPRPAGGSGRLACAMAGPRAAARSRRGAGVRRQPRRHRARRLALSGHCDGTQMVANFVRYGGAAINQLARVAGASLRVIPLDASTSRRRISPRRRQWTSRSLPRRGRGRLRRGRRRCRLSSASARWASWCNTTAAGGTCGRAVPGAAARSWAGRGTRRRRRGPLAQARCHRCGADARHAALLGDPLAVAAALGGRELAAILGATLAALVYITHPGAARSSASSRPPRRRRSRGSPPTGSPTRSPRTSRPRPPIAPCSPMSSSARAPVSISACASAKPPAPPSRSCCCCAALSPATPAEWRPSPKRGGGAG